MNRRRNTSLSLLVVLLCAVRIANAQDVQIGSIDFFGLDKVSVDDARAALPLARGDRLDLSAERPTVLAEAERRLESLSGIVRAQVNLVCCEAGRVLVFVGVREWGRGEMRLRPPPDGSVRLPAEVLQLGDQFTRALAAAAQVGAVTEDTSSGHALSADPELRAIQQKFVVVAAHDRRVLRRVLRDCSDARHRALAAQIIGYERRKQDVVADLVFAMSDVSVEVRNNAARALALFAGMVKKEDRPRLPYEPFIEMLRSTEWSDRNKASFALAFLAESRDPVLLRLLDPDILKSLAEMARWTSKAHALSAALVLGRVGGLSDEVIHAAWDRNDRESIIEAAVPGLGY